MINVGEGRCDVEIFIRKTVQAGSVLEIEEYFSNEKNTETVNKRYPAVDPEKAKETEYKRKVKRLSRLINANFGEGDLFITLSYRKSATIQRANANLINYLTRLKRYRNRNGLSPLKYIYVTEIGNGGANKHHHLLVNGMSIDYVINEWKFGKAIVSKLVPHSDYTGLTHYITKENKRKYACSYCRSRNLVVPLEIIEPAQMSIENISLPKEYAGWHVVVNENYSSDITVRKYLKAIAPEGHDYSEGDELLR